MLIAGTTRTLFAVVTRYFGFSHETARQAVRANLGPGTNSRPGWWASGTTLRPPIRRDRNCRWTGAIDRHYVPFYGDRNSPGIIGGPNKAGTSCFHAYATCALIHKRRRYTVGLLSVTKGPSGASRCEPFSINSLPAGGPRAGWCGTPGSAAGTRSVLPERNLDCAVPIPKEGSGTNRRSACYTQPHGATTPMDWVTEKSRKPVPTQVLVWQRKGEGTARVCAFRGWGDATPGSEAHRARLGRRRYRERFGIEARYRQKSQARGWTTGTNPEYRLRLEGVGLLLRQGAPAPADRAHNGLRRAPGWPDARWPGCSTGSHHASAPGTRARDVSP
ncbi:MAG TPA: hypothetical protein VGE74_10570 [Gemmata sp.]